MSIWIVEAQIFGDSTSEFKPYKDHDCGFFRSEEGAWKYVERFDEDWRQHFRVVEYAPVTKRA